MVKNKNDKSKIGNWIDGDVFALRIQSEKYHKYNKQYLIFIHCELNKVGWEMTRTRNLFRVKITTNKKLPKTKEEIDDLEYVKIDFIGYLLAKSRFPEETKGLYSDQYHFVYEYLLVAWAPKYKIPEDLIYLGHFDIKEPKNEYIPLTQHHGILYQPWVNPYFGDKIEDYILESYEYYNLKKGEIYSKEYQSDFLAKEQEEIEYWKQSDINLKEMMKLYNAGLLPKLRKLNDTETYVGGGEDPSLKK